MATHWSMTVDNGARLPSVLNLRQFLEGFDFLDGVDANMYATLLVVIVIINIYCHYIWRTSMIDEPVIKYENLNVNQRKQNKPAYLVKLPCRLASR